MSETPDDASLQAIHLCCSTRRNLNNDLLSFSIEHLDVAWLAPTFSLVELDHDFHLSATALLFDQASKKLWGSVNKLGQQVAWLIWREVHGPIHIEVHYCGQTFWLEHWLEHLLSHGCVEFIAIQE